MTEQQVTEKKEEVLDQQVETLGETVEGTDSETTETEDQTVITEPSTVDVSEEEAAEPEQKPVYLVHRGRLDSSASILGATLVSYTLNLLGEVNAKERFETTEAYTNFIKEKVSGVLYTLFPAGAVSGLTVEYDEENDQIKVGLGMNTDHDLELYSDRTPVTSFIKVQ